MKLLQKDVAGILRVDTMTVNNWERNRCQPKIYLFPMIIPSLGYNPFSPKENPSIVEEIKVYRLTHGLGQKKMAKALGIDPKTLARWEKWKSKPSRKLGEQVLELLGKNPL